MKLSILIPITPERYDTVKPLLNLILGDWKEIIGESYLNTGYFYGRSVSEKYNGEVEMLFLSDNKEMTLGEKREKLYRAATGEYSFMIDSDDLISEDAIELILAAIDQKPDCITFRENCMMNGVYKSSNHSLKYDVWRDNYDGFDYVRSPFYKDVIKTEIARSVPFPYIRWNEDEIWAGDLYDKLKSEVHIDKELYYYIYNIQPEESHEKRYGIV